MKKHTRQFVTTVAACTLIGAMAIGGTMAYFTDSDEAINTFTVGDGDGAEGIKVELTEPNYPGNDSEEVKGLLPNQEVLKDPLVTNTGKSESIVYMTLEVPMAEVTVVGADGTKGEKGLQELFWLKQKDDVAGSARSSFNSAWLQLPGMTVEGGTPEAPVMSYVFAYKTKLAVGNPTEALFDKVQLKNIIENEVGADKALDINIKVYAIQAEAIYKEDTDTDLTDVDELNQLDTSNLIEIYNIYVNQNSDSVPEVPQP